MKPVMNDDNDNDNDNDNNSFGINQNENQNHAVIVLASGLSQRLGQSKQLLTKNSEPLIKYMVELALGSQAKKVIVVIPENNLAISSIVDKLAQQKSIIQTVVNPNSESGMAQSLSLAIEALTNSQNLAIDRVLIMGVDQALLDFRHLQQLLIKDNTVVASSYPHLEDNFATNNTKENIVGLPIAIDYKLLKKWQTQLSGDKGLRHLIRALPVEHISTVINSQLSYDIDTPQQLAYAQQQGWLDH